MVSSPNPSTEYRHHFSPPSNLALAAQDEVMAVTLTATQRLDF